MQVVRAEFPSVFAHCDGKHVSRKGSFARQAFLRKAQTFQDTRSRLSVHKGVSKRLLCETPWLLLSCLDLC